MVWKSLANWSGWLIALFSAVWMASVIGYAALRTVLAQKLSSASADTYFIVVHVHHPFAVLFGPPLLSFATWLWRQRGTRSAS